MEYRGRRGVSVIPGTLESRMAYYDLTYGNDYYDHAFNYPSTLDYTSKLHSSNLEDFNYTRYVDVRYRPEMSFMDDPSFFNGDMLRLQIEHKNPVTQLVRDRVIDWIDKYFSDMYINLPYPRWVELWKMAMMEIDSPFWAAMSMMGFYSLDDLLYDNNVSIVRDRRRESSDTGQEQGTTGKTYNSSRSRNDIGQVKVTDTLDRVTVTDDLGQVHTTENIGVVRVTDKLDQVHTTENIDAVKVTSDFDVVHNTDNIGLVEVTDQYDIVKTVVDTSQTTDGTMNSGERTTTTTQINPSHGVAVNSSFPPKQVDGFDVPNAGLADTTTVLNGGAPPNTNWSYADAMSENWGTGGTSKADTAAVTDTSTTTIEGTTDSTTQDRTDTHTTAERVDEQTTDARTDTQTTDARVDQSLVDARTDTHTTDARTDETTVDARTDTHSTDARTDTHTTDARTDKNIAEQANQSNSYLNALGYRIMNARGDRDQYDMLTNKMVAYELQRLLETLISNLPFNLLREFLGKLFLQVW